MIYGVAVLALCFLIGRIAGDLLGQWIGVDANVGGVGFSMILLIFSMQWLRRVRAGDGSIDSGIVFWSNLYIPVIVAMSAIQNVKGAIGSGVIAILTGVIPTAICFLLVRFFSRHSRRGDQPVPDGKSL